jgi:hypothetical protein
LPAYACVSSYISSLVWIWRLNVRGILYQAWHFGSSRFLTSLTLKKKMAAWLLLHQKTTIVTTLRYTLLHHNITKHISNSSSVCRCQHCVVYCPSHRER